jgi:hypothetical protein
LTGSGGDRLERDGAAAAAVDGVEGEEEGVEEEGVEREERRQRAIIAKSKTQRLSSHRPSWPTGPI